VFQNYALFPHKRVFDNVAFGLRMRKVPKAEIRERVPRMLELTRCQGLEQRYPGELSGGQQQRIALARALVIEPDVLALDEPLGSLDKKLREELQVELRNLHQTLRTTTLFVTHDQEEALAMADRVAVMNQGRIQQIGSPREIYEFPRSGFVADFIGTTNFFHGKVISRKADLFLAECEGLRIEALAVGADIEIGKEVSLAVRPEKIILSHQKTENLNCFGAQIINIIYLGSETHYYLEMVREKQLGEKKLVIFDQNAESQISFAVGEEVFVSWKTQHTSVLPG
jgi:ABC-type Fe3+/spermidine/putrescine transport system ATPase subunit